MHEEDFGLLWKHTDSHTGKFRAVRSRRLVISSIATIGNYVYGFFWYFYQDGTIGAAGIPPTAVPPKAASTVLIAPGIASHVHQHSFNFRFDMCVDGPGRGREQDFEATPLSLANPHGNAVTIVERPLSRESEAARDRPRPLALVEDRQHQPDQRAGPYLPR